MRLIVLSLAGEELGGIERQTLYMAAGFRDSGQIEPLLATNNAKTPFAQAFARLHMPVETCPSLGGSLFQASVEIDSLIRRYDAKVIQTHTFRAGIVGSLARLGRQNVRHIARVHTYIDCSWIPDWKKRAYHCLSRLTNRGVDHFVPINGLAKRELIERTGISARRITVVPNGVPSLGTPDESQTSMVPLEPRIAMVSNLVEHKGHDVLIRALAELKRRGLIIRARLIGGEHTNSSAEKEATITNQVRELARRAGVLDQLEFYGFTTNVYQALQGIPVVVLPSDSEGLPNCLLEAMSVRKVIVASRVGGIPEIVTHGMNGLLHGYQDHSGMADLLQNVFSTPAHDWEDMRNCAVKTWETCFSVDTMVERLLDITCGM